MSSGRSPARTPHPPGLAGRAEHPEPEPVEAGGASSPSGDTETRQMVNQPGWRLGLREQRSNGDSASWGPGRQGATHYCNLSATNAT